MRVRLGPCLLLGRLVPEGELVAVLLLVSSVVDPRNPRHLLVILIHFHNLFVFLPAEFDDRVSLGSLLLGDVRDQVLHPLVVLGLYLLNLCFLLVNWIGF